MRSLRLVPVLLAVAAGLHLAVLPSHLEEGALVGAFFAVVAVGQLASTVVIHRCAGAWARAVIILANLGVVAVWLVSRTVGLALGGHDAAPEPVQLLDALSVAAELAAVAGLALVGSHRPAGASRWGGVPGLVVVALLAAGVALPVAPGADAHEHPHAFVHHHG